MRSHCHPGLRMAGSLEIRVLRLEVAAAKCGRAVIAATQRPLAASTLGEPSGTPAWKTIPSWAVIGTADKVIPPALLESMAKRAKAHITKVNAGHLSLISNPGVVTRVIIEAARATG